MSCEDGCRAQSKDWRWSRRALLSCLAWSLRRPKLTCASACKTRTGGTSRLPKSKLAGCLNRGLSVLTSKRWNIRRCTQLHVDFHRIFSGLQSAIQQASLQLCRPRSTFCRGAFRSVDRSLSRLPDSVPCKRANSWWKIAKFHARKSSTAERPKLMHIWSPRSQI